jgi:hypothetical protein
MQEVIIYSKKRPEEFRFFEAFKNLDSGEMLFIITEEEIEKLKVDGSEGYVTKLQIISQEEL